MFRLNSLEVSGHQVLGDFSLSFSNNENNQNLMYTTVIIGKNGIGKSYLLQILIEIYDYLYAYADGKKLPSLTYNFWLSQTTDVNLIELSNVRDKAELGYSGYKHKGVFIIVNGHREYNLNRSLLPQKIIASSTNISDRFPSVSNSHYIYKGLKNESTRNQISTRNMERRVADSLFTLIAKSPDYRERLTYILCDTLELAPHMELQYSIKYREHFFQTNMNSNMLLGRIEELLNKPGYGWKPKEYRAELYREDDMLGRACDFLRRWAVRWDDMPKSQMKIRIDLYGDYDLLEQDIPVLRFLNKFKILSYPKIKLFKYANDFDLTDASSGEIALLCQLVNIMSAIDSNSLVLIDEPEISLHPNWQIRYMELLNHALAGYANSHVVISTHCHFILTDLKPTSSKIIALEREGNEPIHDIGNNLNTFCWSVDDILYRVFKVRNTRNRAFEHDMEQLYRLITDGKKESDEVKTIITRLDKIVLGESDPLKSLISMAK